MRDVPDFPTEGIVFKDLMPLIGHAEAFRSTIEHLADWSRPRDPDVILGAEARGFIFGGAITVEYVFSYPGLGLLTVQAIGSKDFPLLQGLFLLFSAAVILANLIADIFYSALDPRVRAG